MADGIPTDRVKQLKQQSYTNSQIIDILQRDGFSSTQIFDALNHASTPDAAPATQPPSLDDAVPSIAPQAQSIRQPAPERVEPPSGMNVSTEEYIESVIDEKWSAIEHDIQKVVDWKNRSETRLVQLEQQVKDLKERFEKLHAALIGKIETYDKNIVEVGAEIKAMEKVFSKVLPVFTDNVKQLDEITSRFGRGESRDEPQPRSRVAR